MEPGAVAAASRSGGAAVAFSWEQEPGVSKEQSDMAEPCCGKPAAGRRQQGSSEAGGGRTNPASTTTKKAPAAAAAHPHRLRVPPPPGGPGAPSASPPGKSRGVRPRDDPFLAAYLACCTDGGSDGGRRHGHGAGSRMTQGRKLLGRAGLGLGLGIGLGLGLGSRGLGLSCKGTCGAVENCVVRLAQIPQLKED